MHPKNQPKIGLVTVLYNSTDVLPEFFSCLAEQSYENYLIYIIENSPSQNSIEDAKTLAEKYKIPYKAIVNLENLGVAKGNNQGINAALIDRCEFILLLNNDIEFGRDAIREMVRFSTENNENIVVPKIFYAGSNIIWQAGGGVSKLTGVGYHVGINTKDNANFNKIQHYENSSTCFALIHTAVFKKTGQMDEKYFVYYDDTDFFLRANRRGYAVCYNPNIQVFHKVSHSTGGSNSAFSLYYGNRNLVYFFKKNFPVPIFILYTFILLAKSLIKLPILGKAGAKIVAKGLMDGFRL